VTNLSRNDSDAGFDEEFACVEVVYWGIFRAGSVKRLCQERAAAAM